MKELDKLKRLETKKANKLVRKDLDVKVFEFKIRTNKLNLEEQSKLKMMFVEAKWLYNFALSNPFEFDTKVKKITKLNKAKEIEPVNLTLPAKIRQDIVYGLQQNIKNLSRKKEKGQRVGKLKYKSNYNSIELSQYKNTHFYKNGKIKIVGFKNPLHLDGLAQLPLEAELVNAKLVKKASGYYIKQTVYLKPKEDKATEHAVGIDFGITDHFALDNGETFNCLIEEPERLKTLQRKLQRQTKRSNNHYKTRISLEKCFEKLTNKKNDAANKFVSKLNKVYQVICIQDEAIKEWHTNKKRKYSRVVQHSILGRVKAKLRRLSKTRMINKWEPTTQLCPVCWERTKHTLDQRTFVCSSCHHKAPRDQKSALVIKLLGLGQTQVKPVEKLATTFFSLESKLDSMKQEAPSFRAG